MGVVLANGSTNIILVQPRLPDGGLVLNVLLRPLPLLLVMVIEMEGVVVVGWWRRLGVVVLMVVGVYVVVVVVVVAMLEVLFHEWILLSCQLRIDRCGRNL